MIPEECWKTWREFRKTIHGKKVIFFGATRDWAAKTLEQCDVDLEVIVDNHRGHDIPGCVTMYGVDVLEGKTLEGWFPGKSYIVITAGAYESIVPQLMGYGMRPGEHFCISPALNNLKTISEIHSHEATLLVSCPDHRIYKGIEEPTGGLYLFNTKDPFNYEKVLDGTFHQIVKIDEKHGGGYLVADEHRGACWVTEDFRLQHSFGAEERGLCHGIAYCPESNRAALGYSGLDKVNLYRSWDEIYSFKFRDKHWLNDLCIHDDYLYISLFSHTGNHLKGIYDGGILQIDMKIGAPPPRVYYERHVLLNDIWMPHTVRFFGNQIHYLESMTGKLYRTNKKVLGEFPGFIRGLAYDGSYYYVGQSEARYFDRLETKHIAMSAGFYMFDEETKASKFFSMPTIRQVHDLLVIDDKSYRGEGEEERS
jgi:hypothetical protein